MKISARNQLTGKVTEVKTGVVNCEVSFSIGQHTLKTIITKSAVEEMELKVNDEIIAIVKASNVMLAKDLPSKISARNTIKTTVKDVQAGAVNSQVSLEGKDIAITSIVTISATDELAIKQNDEVYAIIKASDIILAKN
ncbi:MAG: TOBE domain-containing protein [Campylobacteraceae bacterium]|nr:TOBE domain-containing protein [Campylobacteraceae bacterium]